MHDIEIILHDDSTLTIEERKRDFSNLSHCVEYIDHFHTGDALNGLDATNYETTMNSKGQSSIRDAAAITKAPLIVAANRAKNGLNSTFAKLNNGITTPRQSETAKSIAGNSRDELQIDTNLATAQDDEQGGAAPKEYSRRLVEYFVVVSSVPKPIPSRERVDSNGSVEDSGTTNVSVDGSELPTPKLLNHKSPKADAESAKEQKQQPVSSKTGSKITSRKAARVDKRRGHLRESFRPGESIIPETSLSVSALNIMSDEELENNEQTRGNSAASVNSNTRDSSIHSNGQSTQQGHTKIKGNKFPSMTEHKKKFNEKKKRLSMKAINIARSFSGELGKNPQHHDDGDSSSSSSFSNRDDLPTEIVPSAAFQPSSSPRASARCLSSPSVPLQQQREGGATENIRITPIRDYNNDIDDCILEPVITAQYPPVDRPDQPLNPMLSHFCYPQGVENIVPLNEFQMPKIHHFVLTDSKGEKLYGTCLTVFEEYQFEGKREAVENDDISLPSQRDEEEDRNYVECPINGKPSARLHRRRSVNHKYYAPKVLCLLSTWPYLAAFRTYLTQLYRLATTTTLMTAPLERYILNICEEVPAPPPGSFEVQLSILNSSVRFWAPPCDQPIPNVSVNYGILFECLDISNILFAWNTLACERKLLLVSSQMSILTVCAEILCSMLFPMRWSHLYIPVLPRFLTPMLDAPMPYLCGISRDNFPHAVGDISDETVVVDLDRNLITMGSQTPDLPTLPQRRKIKLEAALEKHAGEVFWQARGLKRADVEAVRLSEDENAIEEMLGRANAVWDEQLCVMDEAYYLAHSPDSMSILYDRDDASLEVQKQSRWDAVQEAFLRFYVAMLKDYRKYLPSNTTEQKSWRTSLAMGNNEAKFLADEFVAAQRLDFQPFLEELVSTQQFDDFITRRMYNAGKAPDVTFFDQSIDAKKNRSKLRLKKTETPFLHSANAHRIMKRIDAIEPNKNDLPTNITGEYIYPTWPESFNDSLFGRPRPIPKIISAEFDRRAALAAMLKEKRDVAEERQSGCFNPSPESTAFVLFFVMFNQVIGRDWDSFKKQHGNMLDDGGNMLDDGLDDEDFTVDVSVPISSSPVSPGPWTPAINPPWMAGESFHSLHSILRPQEKNETVVDERNEVSRNGFCVPDCDNFCTKKAIDPATFIGMPWDNITSEPRHTDNTPVDVDEEFETSYLKARSVAKAQVDLGVNTLKMMKRRKLPSEAITYKSLIEACGRCGIAHRATQLLEMMTQDGLALDSEVYYCFMKAFAQDDTETIMSSHHADTMSEISSYAPSMVSGISRSGNTLNRRATLDSSTTLGSKLRRHSSHFMGEINHVMTSSLEENKRAFKSARNMRMNRLFRRTLTKEADVIVTNAVRTHLDLSNCILEDLYPGLVIDTNSDTCPKCSCVLGQDNIILGWTPCEVNDFSTACPSCKHRFVPKFSVTCSLESFQGSQGEGTTLFVDYLSPWVLLRQIKKIIGPTSLHMCAKAAKLMGVDNHDINDTPQGVEAIIDPTFREGSGVNATLWWNIIVTFKRFKIPYTFLLQGSFPDQQLIMPSMNDI